MVKKAAKKKPVQKKAVNKVAKPTKAAPQKKQAKTGKEKMPVNELKKAAIAAARRRLAMQ